MHRLQPGMPRETQVRVARALSVGSAVVALGCILLLLGDHLLAVRAAAAEKERVERLEAQVKMDAGAAETLHQERDAQTGASLGRKARRRGAAWVLLAAGGVFVGGGRWFLSLRPERSPALEVLVADRLARLLPPGAGRPRPAAAPSPSAPGADGAAFVEELVRRFGRSREAAIPILQAIQQHYRYLPDEVLARVCERTDITAAQIAGTSTFYAQFRRSPMGRYLVRVCHGTACHVAGAQQITDELRRHLAIPPQEDTDPRRQFTVDRVACLGCCSLAPVMMIEDETAGRLTPSSAREALDSLSPRP